MGVRGMMEGSLLWRYIDPAGDSDVMGVLFGSRGAGQGGPRLPAAGGLEPGHGGAERLPVAGNRKLHVFGNRKLHSGRAAGDAPVHHADRGDAWSAVLGDEVNGRRPHRPTAAPLPHRQHPRQQLPHAPAPGTAALHAATVRRRPRREPGDHPRERVRGSRRPADGETSRRRREERRRPRCMQFSVAKNVQFSIAIDTTRSTSCTRTWAVCRRGRRRCFWMHASRAVARTTGTSVCSSTT